MYIILLQCSVTIPYQNFNLNQVVILLSLNFSVDTYYHVVLTVIRKNIYFRTRAISFYPKKCYVPITTDFQTVANEKRCEGAINKKKVCRELLY